MAVPQSPATPPAQILRVETPELTQRRGRTQQPATTVPPEPTPRHTVSIKETVTMTPGRSKSQPSQTGPHVILYGTDSISPVTHPYN